MISPDNDQNKILHRVQGKLHSIHHLKDEAGRVIGTVVRPLKVEFHLDDFGQLIVGAFVMALPLAFTEEVWDLGESLSGGRVLAIFVTSLIALALFIWTLFYQGEGDSYKGQFLKRVVAAYVATFCVALFLMILVGKAPLDDIQLTLSRTIIVAFPAVFSATVIDYVK